MNRRHFLKLIGLSPLALPALNLNQLLEDDSIIIAYNDPHISIELSMGLSYDQQVPSYWLLVKSKKELPINFYKNRHVRIDIRPSEGTPKDWWLLSYQRYYDNAPDGSVARYHFQDLQSYIESNRLK